MENTGIKAKIAILSFLQFAVLGAWLPSIDSYLKLGKSTLSTLENGDMHVAAILALPAIVSLFMPVLIGAVADKFIQAQKLMGICHILAAGFLFAATFMVKFPFFYCMMALAMMFYMPTIALNNSVSFNALNVEEMDPAKHFPVVRVWGFVGFLAAMWTTDLLGATAEDIQLWIAAGLGAITAFTAMAMPSCHIGPVKNKQSTASVSQVSVFAIFKRRKTVVFFISAMLLSLLLRIANVMSAGCEGGFKDPSILITITLMTAFVAVLFIPTVLRRFGIRPIAVVSMLACALSICFFSGRGFLDGKLGLVCGVVMFGIASEVFAVAGSLFVWQQSPSEVNSRAQGLFMMITSGLGVGCGSLIAYMLSGAECGLQGYWYIFALCALCLAVAFPIFYRGGLRRSPRA